MLLHPLKFAMRADFCSCSCGCGVCWLGVAFQWSIRLSIGTGMLRSWLGLCCSCMMAGAAFKLLCSGSPLSPASLWACKHFARKHRERIRLSIRHQLMGDVPSKHAEARLAQSAERKVPNLVVVGSSPTVGAFNSYLASPWSHP